MARREGQKGSDEEPASGGERPQDPFVERLRPDPSQPLRRVLTLAGLLGDSDRPGFRRVYFTRDLTYYAEFRSDDVVQMAPIPAEQAPFTGDEATRVTLAREATIEYTRVRTATPIDEFDLDIRLARLGLGVQDDGEYPPRTGDAACHTYYEACLTEGGTCGDTCRGAECNETGPHTVCDPDEGGVTRRRRCDTGWRAGC